MDSKDQELVNDRLSVLTLAKKLGNVSEACRIAGISRDTFYRYQRLFADGGAQALASNNRRAPKLKNRVSTDVERAVLTLAKTQPRFGQSRVASELAQQGLRISPSGVRSVWLRHDLASLEQRLRAAESAEVLSIRPIASVKEQGVKESPVRVGYPHRIDPPEADLVYPAGSSLRFARS